MMRAYVLKAIGDVALEETTRPELDGSGIAGTDGRPSVPDDDCVILKVKAAGICGSDIPRIYKTGAYHHPLVPGHEFSGVIEETGKNVPESMKGKRAGVFPLIPCRECGPCQDLRYEMCENYNYLGSRCDGGFAEYVKVPFWNTVLLPDNVSFEQAAMLEPMSVAMHAVRQSGLETVKENIDPGLPIAVCGLGTIGLFTVMHLKSLGYENIHCVGNKDFQKEKLSLLGIGPDRYTDFKRSDPVADIMEKTKGKGVSAFFECVGTNASLNLGLDLLGASGILRLVGNPASDMALEKKLYWKILRKQLTLSGTWNSSFKGHGRDDWSMVLENLENGSIKPEMFITHRLSLDELGRGFEMMRDKSENYIKVMCLM